VDREDSDGGIRGLAVLVSVYGADRLRCGRDGAVVGDGGGGRIKPGFVGMGKRVAKFRGVGKAGWMERSLVF
jgi:hypothetical protein